MMGVSSLATLGSPVPLQSQPVARFVDCQVPDFRYFQAQDQIHCSKDFVKVEVFSWVSQLSY